MRVLMISPGFPAEMPRFVRGLAEVGAQVIGLGEQPDGALPPMTRNALHDYLQVSSLWDEAAVEVSVRRLAAQTPIDRVECLWEPGMMLAARLREALQLPGMNREATLPFRDKGEMKRRLDAAGIRTPRHARAKTERACRDAAERLGYPLIIKPIAGAGSADTHRIDDSRDLDAVLPRIRHVAEVSVEEFIDGEEFTFDTICADGQILFDNVAWYRPRPLIARSVEWISPQTVVLRDPPASGLAAGMQMGRAVLQALNFLTGFTHMEWFRTQAGEVVFGEIAARAPGARSVDIMNWAHECDAFTGWAEAVCHGRLSQKPLRRFNSAVIFKRAQGRGRIAHITGLEGLVATLRPHLCEIDLLPPGAPRRDWKQTLVSDGYVIVRHPDLQSTVEMADRIGSELQMIAR